MIYSHSKDWLEARRFKREAIYYKSAFLFVLFAFGVAVWVINYCNFFIAQ